MTARFIAFEGAEGCGKSTQAARVAERIGAVLTRETGGTAIGSQLRAILNDPAVDNLTDRAEALLAAADRAQHMVEVVFPALESGRDVISDRSAYSSLAYQGFGRGQDPADIRWINDWATGGRWPDLVVFLDTPDEVIAERMSKRSLDRFESAGSAFHARVIEAYRDFAVADPDHWITIAAVGTVEQVTDQIIAELASRGVGVDQAR